MKKLFVVCLLVGCNSKGQIPADTSDNHVVILDPITIEAEPYTREELLTPVFKAMIQEENDKLRFDEPKTEIGQQDGKLRGYWERAYYRKQKVYAFNGDVYHTMNNDHHPNVPQVCVDFLIDTLDIAAGTWYSNSLSHPALIPGKFEFRKQIEQEGFNSRSADGFIEYVKTRPDDFQFLFDSGDSPEVGSPEALKMWFKDHHVDAGDIVIIRGKAPWDHGKELHWHSFFVSRLDEQGFVSMVMGNAGHAIEWSLEREVKRAPHRKVVAIIRMTNHFLISLQ